MSSASVSPSICSFLYLPLSHSLVCCYQVTVLIAIMVATIAISFSWEILFEEISACFGIVEAVCACYGIESKNDLLLQGPKGPSSRFGQVLKASRSLALQVRRHLSPSQPPPLACYFFLN